MIPKKANKEVGNMLRARLDDILSCSNINSQDHFEKNSALAKTLAKYGIQDEPNDPIRVIDILDGIYIMIRDANTPMK